MCELINEIAYFKENLYNFSILTNEILDNNYQIEKNIMKQLNEAGTDDIFQIKSLLNDVNNSIINFMENFETSFQGLINNFGLMQKIKVYLI